MMIQGNYARAALAKLVKAQEEDRGVPPRELAEVFRQIILWVDMVERKAEQAEVDANRAPRFF